MTETIKHCLKVGLTAGLCLLLTGCGDKVEPPEAYVIGENSTIPLDSCLDEEEGGKLTAIEAPESEEDEKEDKKKKDKEDKDETDEAEPLSEAVDEEESDADGAGGVYIYTYEEVPAAALERYAAALVADEEGFRVIDGERVPQPDLPSFDEEEGSAAFARKAVEENTLFQIAIDWNAEACTVQVSCEPGGFYDEEAAEYSEPAEEDAESILTLGQTVDYVRALRPSDLGLEGESMSEYHLIPMQGNPLVDGEVCRHLNIYQENPSAGTNEIVGNYLVGINKIYKLDPISHSVELVYQR